MEEAYRSHYELLNQFITKYCNAMADLAVLEARVRVLHDLTFKEKNCIFPQEIATIFGWELPAHKDEEDK